MLGLNDVKSRANSAVGRRPATLAASALLLIALLVGACGQAAPTAVPDADADAEPTLEPQATEAPTQEPAATPTTEPMPAAITPAVTVADQAIMHGMVTIAEVVSAGPGWLVVHAQQDGNPGPVLGYSPVNEGENADVTVMIDVAQATETLYAMLHTDAGEVGTYEFPGVDGPVSIGEQMVNPAFAVTGGLEAAPTPEPAAASPTDAPTPEATASGAAMAATDEGEVELEDFQFVPRVLTIKVGTEVKFSNKDDVTHTVTSDTGLFDSGGLSKGEEFYYTFTEAGEYPYYCAPHGGPGGVGMSGTIIVVP